MTEEQKQRVEQFAAKNPTIVLPRANARMTVNGGVFHRRVGVGVPGLPQGSGTLMQSVARPYHPLFASPDRLQLPVQQAQLNQYWRLYYNMDPIIGGAIDLQAEQPWSDADLVMQDPSDKSNEIMHKYVDMMNDTELLSLLPVISKEYLIIGEVIPFAYWDAKKGSYVHIAIHNPDYIEIISSPFVASDPIITLRISQETRKVLQSTDPRWIKLRSRIPPDILSQLVGGKNLPLDPINVTHIARKAFPYDLRGVSILARLFRILMYEDAVFNGQIQQAQRHAMPLRVFKIGDPDLKWVPNQETRDEFLEMLAAVEADPLASLVYSHALTVEYHGIEGKQLRITQEWDVIEKAKLVALGVNRGLLQGETTYAATSAALQVMMGRWRSFRDMILSNWVYKKLFAQMAELNGFIRPIKKSETVLPARLPDADTEERLTEKITRIAELQDADQMRHELARMRDEVEAFNRNRQEIRVRIASHGREAAAYESNLKPGHVLVYPKLQFTKRLDVRQDEAILRLWVEMYKQGLISARSLVNGAGLDFDSEQASIQKDAPVIAANKVLTQVQSMESDELAGLVGTAAPVGGGGEAGAVPAPESVQKGDETGMGAGAPGSGMESKMASDAWDKLMAQLDRDDVLIRG